MVSNSYNGHLTQFVNKPSDKFKNELVIVYKVAKLCDYCRLIVQGRYNILKYI